MGLDNKQEEPVNEITKKVIGCAFTVSNKLGSGFVEKVYENALAYEMRKVGLSVAQQHPIGVYYDGHLVGGFNADLLVAEQVLVELKATRVLDDAHASQCLNYLRATGLSICLLINFGKPRIEIRRLIV